MQNSRSLCPFLLTPEVFHSPLCVHGSEGGSAGALALVCPSRAEALASDFPRSLLASALLYIEGDARLAIVTWHSPCSVFEFPGVWIGV